jgi:hypothetical protein
MAKKAVKKSLSIPKVVVPALKPRAKEQHGVKGGAEGYRVTVATTRYS